MDQTHKKKTLRDLKQMVEKATPDELSYLLARYGGPHNLILREKIFDYEASKALHRLISDKIAFKLIDDMLSE